MIGRLIKRIACILILGIVLLSAAGCEGGVPESVDAVRPLGEDFVARLYEGDYDGTYAQLSDDMRVSITRRAWEEDIFPQIFGHGGGLKDVRFASAYPAAGGTKLWLHMKQEKAVVVYCFVFDPEGTITDFTFR